MACSGMSRLIMLFSEILRWVFVQSLVFQGCGPGRRVRARVLFIVDVASCIASYFAEMGHDHDGDKAGSEGILAADFLFAL